MHYDTEHCNEVLRLLSDAHPDAAPELRFKNPFELLIATILSAQCTDKQVNRCTETLFRDYPDAESMARISPDKLSQYIRPCGFFNTKGKNILATCNMLISMYGGEVPQTMEELVSLPGVGRKTANVVLSNAFKKPAIAVDTHVARVSNRLGLADSNDVLKIEKQLMENIPEDKWSIAHHWLIFNGRRVCSSKKPKCGECTLKSVCRHYAEETEVRAEAAGGSSAL